MVVVLDWILCMIVLRSLLCLYFLIKLISVAHQEDNDSKRNFSNNPSKHQHPVLESFFEPVFRPSPPDQKGPNDIMAKLNQIKNQVL